MQPTKSTVKINQLNDYLEVMREAVGYHTSPLPHAPIDSTEGHRYLKAMRCAINHAFANRQVIAHNTRRSFERALGLNPSEIGLRTLYEVPITSRRSRSIRWSWAASRAVGIP